MKVLKHLLFFGLLFMTQFTKAMVTAAQLTGLTNSSAATSASTFYSLVSADTTMSQSQFYGYYTPNFIQLPSSAPLNTLIQAYANDIADQNFNQAEIDLIKLSAAVLRNLTKGFTQTAFLSATDPWGSGNKFLVITPGNGNPSQQMVQLLINEFINLYPQISGTITPLKPGQKPVSSVTLLTEKNNATNDINQAVTNAKAALQADMDSTTLSLGAIEAQALADNNLGNNKVELGYLSQISTLSITVQGNLNSTASDYVSQVTSIGNTANENLEILVSQGADAGTAAIYENDINELVTAATGQINSASQNQISTLKSLVNSVSDTISSASTDDNNSGNNNGGDGGGSDDGDSTWDVVKKYVLEEATPILVGLAGTIKLLLTQTGKFYAKKIACGIYGGFSMCSQKSADDAAAQKFLEENNLPTQINGSGGLIQAIAEGDATVVDLASLINKSPSVISYMQSNLQDSLGITEAQLTTLLGGGSPGKVLTNLITNLGSAVDQVQKLNSDAIVEDILGQIGTELTASTPASFSNMSDLVSRVNTALGGESSTFNTGSGAAATNIAAEYGPAFEGLEGMTSVSSMVTQIAAKVGTGEGQISLDQLISDAQSMREALDGMAAEVKAGKATAEDMQTLQDAADAADQVIWNSENLED